MLDYTMDYTYTEVDLESSLQNGHQYLNRNQYDKAIDAYQHAREAALALGLTAHLTDIDQLIRRAHDQVSGYAHITRLASAFSQITGLADRFDALSELDRMIGLFTAMDRGRSPDLYTNLHYQELANLARTTRQSLIANLSSETLLELARKAMDHQDYALASVLLSGVVSDEDAPTHQLQQRAEAILETKVVPKVDEAAQYLNQSRPMDGLGPLQDLRREFPKCPSWREPWFALCRKQGEFLIDRGRQYVAEAQYVEALKAFKKAYQTFVRGREAYPDAEPVQSLLTLVRDLLTVTQQMQEAYHLLQDQQEMEAYDVYKALHHELSSLDEEGRLYSLIQYGVNLHLERLRDKLGLDSEGGEPEENTSDTREIPPASMSINAEVSQEPEVIEQAATSESSDDPKDLQPEQDTPTQPEDTETFSAPIAHHIQDMASAASVIEEAGLEATSSSMERLGQWLISVEPFVAQARAAFMRNDLQAVVQTFRKLAQNMEGSVYDTPTTPGGK
jgi:tetratricopeptide (TPR) repeat protein